MSVGPVMARAELDLSRGEGLRCVAIGENPQGLLEGVVLTDRRIGVIDRSEVRWFSRDVVWEVSSMSTHPATGEVLRIYGEPWELAWTQLKPPSVGDQIKADLTSERCPS